MKKELIFILCLFMILGIVHAAPAFGNAVYLDGNGDYLSIPDNNDWDFGNGDFTIDLWFLPTLVNPPQGLVTANSDFELKVVTSNNEIAFSAWDTNNTRHNHFYGDIVVLNDLLNEWHHLALVRSSNTLNLFVDGTLKVSESITYTFKNVDNPLLIGTNARVGNSFQGYLDEVRVTKGNARWTSNFTPLGTPYDTDENTKLLLHLENFTDSSAQQHLVQAYGDAGIQINQGPQGYGAEVPEPMTIIFLCLGFVIYWKKFNNTGQNNS